MSILNNEEKELQQLILDICSYLRQLVSAKGEDASELRRRIGDVEANWLEYIAARTFGDRLWACFESARKLPISSDRIAAVRVQIEALKPTGENSLVVLDIAILFCLTTESIFLTKVEFRSSNDARAKMEQMREAFGRARDNAADRMDSATYQQLTYLSGSLINHLSSTALKLPQLTEFHFLKRMPSLRLANSIYQDANRSNDLEDENKVVHPLFMPADIRGLSA